MDRRLLAFLLTLCMVLGMVPATAFAEGEENGGAASVTPAKPNATVEKLEATILPADSYWCWPSGDNAIDRPLDIVMNFKANDTVEEAEAGGYGDWICDFYVTVSEMTNDTITTDDCYLAGNYGSYGWIVIPMDGLTVTEGAICPVVSNFDPNLTYENVCDYVREFTAAIHISDEIINENPNLNILLELKMTNPNDPNEVLRVGGYNYTVGDLRSEEAFVAKVGETPFIDLQAAIKAAAPSGTVELLSDVTVDKWVMISEILTIGDGTVITLDMNGLTINGNNHTLTVNDVESANNGNHLFYDGDYNITNLAIVMGDNVNGLGITSGTIKNVTFIGGHGISAGAAIHVSDGQITGVHAGEVTIEGCTFQNNGGAIYFETAQNGLVVNKNTFQSPEGANVIMFRGTEKFTNNTVESGRTVNVVSGSPVVTGNNFNNVRLKVYNEATAEIIGNRIDNLVFNDTNEVKSTFKDNILSDAAKAALSALRVEQSSIVVTFNSNGGSAVDAQTVSYGAVTVAPANPTRSGYTFGGWYTDEACTSAYDFEALVTGDITLYAKWTKNQTSRPSSKPSSKPTTPAEPTISTDNKTEENAAGDQVTTTETTVKPETTVTGGTAKTEISESAANKIVETATKSESSSVVITPEVDETKDVDKVEVTIAASTVEKIGTETDANLTVSTPVADVEIANAGLNDLAKEGEKVTVSAEKKDDTIVVEVKADNKNVNKVNGGLTVTIPQEEVSAGTVAVIVHEDGTEEIVRQTVGGENALTIPLDGSATIKIVDNSKDFDDVEDTDWHSDAVDFAASRELFNGTSKTTFSPSGDMTRGMLAMVLHNLENNPESETENGFDDVQDSKYYAGAVSWAAEKGLVSGYSNGGFGPEDKITREQLAVILWKYAGCPESDHELDFEDEANIAGYAKAALQWANEHKIINGKGSGKLDPSGNATRAEVAQMLKNFMENTKK